VTITQGNIGQERTPVVSCPWVYVIRILGQVKVEVLPIRDLVILCVQGETRKRRGRHAMAYLRGTVGFMILQIRNAFAVRRGKIVIINDEICV
jgi:hypothetical protein